MIDYINEACTSYPGIRLLIALGVVVLIGIAVEAVDALWDAFRS